MVRCSEPEERCFIDAYLRKLPPTLHKRNRLPIPSCSKAPRGLFVQQRVPGIFTGSSISPSPWLRECSDRYAFRAGRNFTFILSIIANGADYIFIFSIVYFLLLDRFIDSARDTKPCMFSDFRCFPSKMSKQIFLKLRKLFSLEETKGYFSK
jgi:hypothetical protein